MSNTFSEATADLRKASADLDGVRAAKAAATPHDFQRADSNKFARDTARREGWTRTGGPSGKRASRKR